MSAIAHRSWKNQLSTEPMRWLCNVLWGGNEFALEHFTMPGLQGYLVSVPFDDSGIGGDIHYITVCDHGVFSKFLVLDVAGHGDSAAPISQRLKEPLFRLMKELDNRAIFMELNDSILSNERTGTFATAASATYNYWDQSWTYAYAGHPNMLVRRHGSWQKLSEQGASSLPVGILGDTEYFQNAVRLGEAEWILMFSDVLLEIRGPDGQQLGFPGLMDILNSVQEDEVGPFYHALAHRLIESNGSERFSDDLTIILLKHQTLPRAGVARVKTQMVQWMRRGMMALMKAMRFRRRQP